LKKGEKNISKKAKYIGLKNYIFITVMLTPFFEASAVLTYFISSD